MTDGVGHRMIRRARRALRAHRNGPAAAPAGPPAETGRRGTPREAPEERTNLGPVMDAAVARTRRAMQPAGLDADYDLAHEHFDVRHFLQQARHLIDAEGADPLRIFLGNGADAKGSPEINFSMPAYLRRHPQHARGRERSPYLEWLKRGRAAGEIADPAPAPELMAPVLGLETAELVELLGATRLDLQERLRTGTLGEMFARAAEVEPLIGDLWTATTQPVIPPLATANAVRQVSAIFQAQRAAGFARARLVLVVADPRWGGGRRVEGHIAHGLAGHLAPQDIVVVYTDDGGSAPPGRFPEGVREVDLSALVAGMDRAAAMRALVELVRSFRADAVVNINSRLLYDAMATYGRALAATERLFLVMFGNERLAMGNWVGVPIRFFYRCFDLVEGVITDSEHLADWLRERHQLGDAEGRRIHVLRAPVDAAVPVAAPPPADPARRPQVYWAGRWDRQKRLDLALEVARRMPDVDLRVWGEPVLASGPVVPAAPGNVTLEGRYAHLSDVDLGAADAWLYTAAWDGVPSQLLEVAMTGLPIVSSLVGGIGEVLSDEDAWLVTDSDDPDAYVAALREVLADPDKARRRSAGLRERLLRERTEAAYARDVSALLLPADRLEEDAR